MDYYEEAVNIHERRELPKTDLGVDRRVLAHLREVYRDETVQTLICIACAEKNMYLRGHDRFGAPADVGEIRYRSLRDLDRIIKDRGHNGVFKHNFDFEPFRLQYATTTPEEGLSPLAEAPELGPENLEWRRIFQLSTGNAIAICCPEDIQQTARCNHSLHVVCGHCRLPICDECFAHMQMGEQGRVPQALANDKFQGCMHIFIVERQVRWIEAVFACPIYTCMISFYIEGPICHLMKEALGQQGRTSGVRGNVCSFRMAWKETIEQLHDFVPDATLET